MRSGVSPRFRLPAAEKQALVPIAILVMFGAIVTYFNPRFAGYDNLSNLGAQIVPSGIVAIGIMFVVLSGGIDFSPAYGVSLGAVTAGLVFGTTHSPLFSVVAALAVGVAVGVANGLLVTFAGIQPFIATLGTFSITQGLTLVVSQGKTVFIRHDVFRLIGSGRVAGIPVAFLILVVVYLVAFVLLRQTKIGVCAYAIGDNEQGARYTGINVELYKFLLYVHSGICMAISAIVIMSRISMVASTVGGINLLLDSIAAVILGGTSISGGVGTVGGTFAGVVLVGMIGNALNLLNVPAVAQDVFKGLVILFALGLDVASKSKRNSGGCVWNE